MLRLLLVGAGGAVGAIARFGLGLLVQKVWAAAFPLGTLLVNVLGCLAIGALAPLLEGDPPRLGEGGRLFLVVGFLGGFTTFSAFGFETWSLARRDLGAQALLYAGASLVLGLGAVWAGRALSGPFLRP